MALCLCCCRRLRLRLRCCYSFSIRSFTSSNQRPLVETIARRDRDLGSQIRRALSSVGLNLTEGFGSAAGNGRLRFERARGSLYEAQAGLRLAVAWGYVPTQDCAPTSSFIWKGALRAGRGLLQTREVMSESRCGRECRRRRAYCCCHRNGRGAPAPGASRRGPCRS